MASQLNLNKSKAKFRSAVQKGRNLNWERYLKVFVVLLILTILFLKLSNYAHTDALNPVRWVSNAQSSYKKVSFEISELKYFGKCPKDEIKIYIGQQYLCRKPVAASIYQKIYDTYPRNPNGNEVLYPFFNSYSSTTANAFLHNKYPVPRFKAVTINKLTWDEDPYSSQYWRYNFYSLRIFKDLLDEYTATGNPVYAYKLEAITSSFLTTGVKQPHAWDDYHAVAWRSMMLTDMWWQLRQHNILPIDLSNSILASIVRHGNFLMDPTHYEANYNHGTNEAAALYQLGVAFPTLPGASQWLSQGKQRLGSGLDTIVDSNGALDEHAPYYDFYALQKYWDIYVYSTKYNQRISKDYEKRISAMINYATYILQPNQHPPIIGASLDTQIHDKDEYAEMAKLSPSFEYALTQGKKGKTPASTSVNFTDTGQAIMRSGWTKNNFTNQTQVILNYGPYLTQHSQLNSLSIQLYSGGLSLLPGPGLYTYNPGAMHDYFNGTSSQNTVLVDGNDQEQGTGYSGKFVTKPGYSSASAANQLNQGVTQERQVTLIGSNLVILIDKLSSNSTHTYQQIFHLFPGAHYSSNGLTAVGQGKNSKQRISISQMLPNGVKLYDAYNLRYPGGIAGLCSQQYNVLLPCHQIGYTIRSKNAMFVTALQLGSQNKNVSYKLNSQKTAVLVKDNGKTYTLNIKQTPGFDTKVVTNNKRAPTPKETTLDDFNTPSTWQVKGGSLNVSPDSYAPSTTALSLTNSPGQTATIQKNVNLNLSNKNIEFRMKLPSTVNVQDLNILLYSGNSYAQNRLKNSYDDIHDNDQTNPNVTAGSQNNNGWTTISLGKGMDRTIEGQWSVYGSGFDWSNITSVVFQLSSVDGSPVQVELGKLSTTPAQSEGKIAIIFDDGTTSLLSAYPTLQKNGYKASVAVIGKYSGRNFTGYLSIAQLRQLKNSGWSLVNHSYYHQDAVATYYNQNNLSGLKADILEGAYFLEQNNLDTDPNWYIYPHGTSNQAIEAVVGEYYKFARTELTAPEVYPFGNPLAVKDFVVEDTTTPQEVEAAIADANTYHLTLILTFHRIHANPGDKSGYDLSNFKQIVNYLKSTKSNVMSLNQLDASNGVPINKTKITEGRPSQLTGTISVQQEPFWKRLAKL